MTPSPTLFVQTFTTPLGDFSIAIDGSGAVVATAFGDVAALERRMKQCRLAHAATHAVRPGTATLFREIRAQLRAYFAGERQFFELPFAAQGTAFQQRVWQALLAIPFGETRSYAELAQQLGSGPRAVGGANAANPICLFVPCHRVIGADGSLTGFAFGSSIKRKLLDHEAAHRPMSRAGRERYVA